MKPPSIQQTMLKSVATRVNMLAQHSQSAKRPISAKTKKKNEGKNPARTYYEDVFGERSSDVKRVAPLS
jgi:hypothetical protein